MAPQASRQQSARNYRYTLARHGSVHSCPGTTAPVLVATLGDSAAFDPVHDSCHCASRFWRVFSSSQGEIRHRNFMLLVGRALLWTWGILSNIATCRAVLSHCRAGRPEPA